MKNRGRIDGLCCLPVRVLALFMVLFLPGGLHAQVMGQREAARFASALLSGGPSLEAWMSPASLQMSRRFGISYDGARCKFLIANDLDDSVRQILLRDPSRYTVETDTLVDGFSRVRLTAPTLNLNKEYYFTGSKCITAFEYYSRGWKTINTPHFRFFVSDTAQFNRYCILRLESFLAQMGRLLGLRPVDMQLLATEKVYYYLCKDEEEVQQLTGFRARGMFNLAYDAIITTYNLHLHELIHLLMNFRLRHLPLYTHPLLQEGFAVAFGGRGGLDARVLDDVGKFLYENNVIGLSELLDRAQFEQLDASLSYPASGLYNRFLVETMGMPAYLRLYLSHSGASGDSVVHTLDTTELPSSAKWLSYLHGPTLQNPIVPGRWSGKNPIVRGDSTLNVSEDSTHYYFALRSEACIADSVHCPGYASRLYREISPGRAYRGDHFLLKATADEVALYDLFTNTMILSYAANFALPQEPVPSDSGWYYFHIAKKAFEPWNSSADRISPRSSTMMK